MSLFKGSEPAMPRQRQPYNPQNFSSLCIAFAAIVLFSLLVAGFCFFKYVDDQPPTPAEIKHKEHVEELCKELSKDDRYDCLKEAEGWDDY